MELEELAEDLRQGWGPELRLGVDPGFPPELLTQALRQLSPLPQRIRLNAREARPEQAKQALQENLVDLAISSQVGFGFAGRELLAIEHVAVAHPGNPLFALKRDITFDDLKTQFQVLISGEDDYLVTEAHHRLQRYTGHWNVSSLDRAIGVLRHGLGFAWLPKYQVHPWLDSNQIRMLPLVGGASQKSSLYLIFGRPPAAGSAAEHFARALGSCSARFS
jgi:DNA-binding transcriptional LysR family regulator